MSPKQAQTHRTLVGVVLFFGCFILFSLMQSVRNIDSSPHLRHPIALSRDQKRAADTPSRLITVANARDLKLIPITIDISVVADLDKKSKEKSAAEKLKFVSFFRRGQLRREQTNKFTVKWSEPEKFETQMNEGGRGFELSALKWFRGKLFTIDDRTGIVFELFNFRGTKMAKMFATPRYILMEGNGESAKGQKNEWATVKDGEMYIGSIGKEYTDNDGNIINRHNFWVAVINGNGEVSHVDWTENYARIRKALGCDYPGYVIHEAIEWSHVHRKWFILPRRVSHEPYDDMRDEKKGSNHLLIANEDFSDIDVRTVGKITPERGFSAFKFLPNSKDSVIVALKSMENEQLQRQATYITVFDIDGKVWMEETEIPGDGNKYEGIAMLNDWTPREPDFDIAQ